MRKFIEWAVTLGGLGTFLLSKANWIANHLSFLSLPEDVRGALVMMSQIPTILAVSVLLLGLGGLGFLFHEYGLIAACLMRITRLKSNANYAAIDRDDNRRQSFSLPISLRLPNAVIFGLALATIGIIVAAAGWLRLPSTSATPITISSTIAEVCAVPLSAEEDRFRQDLRKFVRSNVADINRFLVI